MKSKKSRTETEYSPARFEASFLNIGNRNRRSGWGICHVRSKNLNTIYIKKKIEIQQQQEFKETRLIDFKANSEPQKSAYSTLTKNRYRPGRFHLSLKIGLK